MSPVRSRSPAPSIQQLTDSGTSDVFSIVFKTPRGLAFLSKGRSHDNSRSAARGLSEDFTPLLGIKQTTAPVLRNALSERGVEVFDNSKTRFPSGAASGGFAIRARTEVINAAEKTPAFLGK